mmetsp:Transcript_87548/g.151595  ORF Transcript_87548/g.151595 Transcript_87548/m.151595 type:complete len:274 (+) Transcript_87548:26-847(+)
MQAGMLTTLLQAFKTWMSETVMPCLHEESTVTEKAAETAGETFNGGKDHPPGGTDDEAVCAICFEEGQFMELPCSCRANYCPSCWDRALVASVTARGQPQCPTCRTCFNVDFNQDAACLVFSKQETGMTLSDWRSRLYDKAKPVQSKLLQSFGAIGKMSSESHPASNTKDRPLTGKPLCICGGVFERIDSRSRAIRMLDDTTTGWRSRGDAEKCIETLAHGRVITCDLCDGVATRTGALWTCSNGPNTLLHPAAFDVCEPCFLKYAGCVKAHA